MCCLLLVSQLNLGYIFDYQMPWKDQFRSRTAALGRERGWETRKENEVGRGSLEKRNARPNRKAKKRRGYGQERHRGGTSDRNLRRLDLKRNRVEAFREGT